MIHKTFPNAKPLFPSKFSRLPLGAIKPKGWLETQLHNMETGMTGRLPEFFPEIGETSGWLGGDGESWERTPYYLDGLVPLAYLTGNTALIARAQRYIDWAIESQREDGFFGPAGNTDRWPRFIMMKALMQYYTAAGDKRVLTLMLRYCRFLYGDLALHPLQGWEKARAIEGVHVLLWLYNVTQKPQLLPLCRLLAEQSYPYVNLFLSFPYTYDLKRSLPWPIERLSDAGQKTFHMTHGVNLAMALKYPGVLYALEGGNRNATAAEAGWEKLIRHHGLNIGIFSCDEHLSGQSPSQGVETCAVVEAMYSMQVLAELTGDVCYGDRLEKLAFNALPAAIGPDCLTHQYDQQPNQIRCDTAKRAWYNNGDDSNTFGVAPNFGCCTVNIHQGYPKYASALWMAAEDGLAAVSYAPCTVHWRAGGEPIRLQVDSRYPYQGRVTLRLSVKNPTRFTLYLRIPQWAQNAQILVGEEKLFPECGCYYALTRDWQEENTIELNLPMSPRFVPGPRQSASVEAGPLLFALPIHERWQPTGSVHGVTEYNVFPESGWNVALCRHLPLERIETDAEYVFKGPSPVKIRAGAVAVDWNVKQNSADAPPVLPSTQNSEMFQVELVPYAHATLRISQFPIITNRQEDSHA